MHGKNATIKSSFVILSNTDCPPPICGFDFVEKVNQVVCFTEVVLYVVIFRRYAKFDELILECSALLKKAVNLAVDFHYLPSYFCASSL